MKLISWNIDSLNAALTSDSDRAKLSRMVLNTIKCQDADLIAIQETKLPADGMSNKIEEALKSYFPDYHIEYVSSQPPAKKGYAGTMMLYKDNIKARALRPALGAPDTMDLEGRIITLELDNCYFVNVYTPNSGDGLKRLSDRQRWDILFADYLSSLDKSKPVIACGDFNVAHKEIDLANPDSNHLSAGFTDEEREGFTNLLSRGFVDTFRQLNGDIKGAYSWWSQRIKTSKINNSGWRIDYFIVSESIAGQVTRSDMLDSGSRQDHAPIIMEISA